MDLYIQTLHQLTLPLLMFEVHPTDHLPSDDGLNLNQTLELFDRDIVNMDAVKNKDEKDYFLEVVFTALARKICCKIRGLEWVTKLYDEHYDHQYKDTATTRTVLHIESPKALDEKKRQDMIELLEDFQERYLTTGCESLRAEEKNEFLQAKQVVETAVSAAQPEEDFKKAEATLSKYVDKFGGLILHGDLLSIASAENAIRTR